MTQIMRRVAGSWRRLGSGALTILGYGLTPYGAAPYGD